jgi:hypothetical protein
MKNKTSLLLILAISFTIVLVSSVSAQETAVAKSDNVNGGQSNNVNQGKNPNVVATDDTTQATDTIAIQETGKKEKKENKGQFNAESHRSAVATFVQSLLAVADREGGIGQEVKVIAQQQNDTKDRASDLINAIENRNKVKTFFIGTSYKNLGELRSQMVQTRNQIDQLKRLADKAENEGDKTELQSQIQVLEQEQTNINNFITQNENKFSLFGWAVKLFRK